MSTPQYEAMQRLALIEHDPPDHARPVARHTTPGVASVASCRRLAIVPAAFWAAIAWLVWGGLAAAIVESSSSSCPSSPWGFSAPP